MKIVFYRTLLKRARNLSPSERILYSFLVAKSILRLEDIYEHEGVTLNTEELVFKLQENRNTIDICDMNRSKIATELNLTRKTVIEGLRHLERLGYISGKRIYVNEELIRHGYFELKRADILKGDLLIFYSYIRDKSAKYDYCIDTYKAILGEQIGKSKIAITKYLNRLYEIGLAKRLENGKLKINI